MSWLAGTSWKTLAETLASALIIYSVVVAVVRINGLRSFAKMSGYDFATTVATGSILAAVTINRSASVLDGAVAICALVGAQRVITELRRRSEIEHVIDNPPTLVLALGAVLPNEMRRTGLSMEDLNSTLRSAGISNPADATAVVFEPTGERSVLTGSIDQFDAAMFANVRGAEHLGLGTAGAERSR